MRTVPICVVCLLVLGSLWMVWRVDRANAVRVAKIKHAVETCRSAPVTRRSFFD